ncbi:MAG: 23S rRNA (uracil(1939)-C(5))-methyltransferase RlmD [Clostridia bacterium]|nr:23S rRNA (uracil(1939)-C(5))-methyltransferase RlmD [Clostridia bacterium]
MRKNDLVTVTVTDMTFDGAGIGHVETGERRFPIFIRAAAVGDRVECRIIKVLKNYAVGIISEILTPSPHRISPACPVSAKCGGCAFCHVSYEGELGYKTQLVRQAYKLNYPAPITVADCVPSPATEGYRNKLQLPLSDDGTFGFYSLHSHRVVSAQGCNVGHPAFLPVIAAVEAWIGANGVSPYDETTGKGLVRHLFLRRGHHSGQIMVCLTVNAAAKNALPAEADLLSRLSKIDGMTSVWLNFNTKKTNVILGDCFSLLWGEERIEDTMNGVRFRISPRSFYQINTAQAEAIYAHAASYLSAEDILLDLYCGIGTIGLTCANKVKELIGIEVVDAAIEDAKKNAALNGIENARFFAADAAKTLEILAELPHKPTAVIVDPPRKGLSADAVAALKEIAPEKIIYISCNPATQARDLALLKDLYVPGEVTPYDMFPRTGHVESVVCLSREKADDYIRISVHTKDLQTKAN